jgi:hypothetical protein
MITDDQFLKQSSSSVDTNIDIESFQLIEEALAEEKPSEGQSLIKTTDSVGNRKRTTGQSGSPLSRSQPLRRGTTQPNLIDDWVSLPSNESTQPVEEKGLTKS